MANNVNYEFAAGEKICIAFDSNGYVTKAKGFGHLMWSTLSSVEVNKDLVGKHIDEVVEILRKNGIGDAYKDFQIHVHIPLLEIMLKEKEKNNN